MKNLVLSYKLVKESKLIAMVKDNQRFNIFSFQVIFQIKNRINSRMFNIFSTEV